MPIALLGYPRGHKVRTETREFSDHGLTRPLLLSLEPVRIQGRQAQMKIQMCRSLRGSAVRGGIQ